MKTHLLKTKTAFTLMELIVVVIIVSILAAFVIPNYQRSLEKAYEKNAIINLKAIAAAQHVYRINNGVFYPTPIMVPKWVSDINTDLNLNIVDNSVDYFCIHFPGTYSCKINYPKGGPPIWEIYMDDGWQDWKPYCQTTPCPTCKDQAGGGC